MLASYKKKSLFLSLNERRAPKKKLFPFGFFLNAAGSCGPGVPLSRVFLVLVFDFLLYSEENPRESFLALKNKLVWTVAVSCNNMYTNLNSRLMYVRRSVNGKLAHECVVM